jgi:hypothetical protein
MPVTILTGTTGAAAYLEFYMTGDSDHCASVYTETSTRNAILYLYQVVLDTYRFPALSDAHCNSGTCCIGS